MAEDFAAAFALTAVLAAYADRLAVKSDRPEEYLLHFLSTKGSR